MKLKEALQLAKLQNTTIKSKTVSAYQQSPSSIAGWLAEDPIHTSEWANVDDWELDYTDRKKIYHVLYIKNCMFKTKSFYTEHQMNYFIKSFKNTDNDYIIMKIKGHAQVAKGVFNK